VSGRQRIRAYGSAAALMLIGVICGFAVSGLVGDIIRLSLITLGLGAVLLLVFYEIGLSEDKARAQEEEERRRRMPEHEEPKERRSWLSGRRRRPS
jgi:uncharacterized membrane protein YfcA